MVQRGQRKFDTCITIATPVFVLFVENEKTSIVKTLEQRIYFHRLQARDFYENFINTHHVLKHARQDGIRNLHNRF